MPKQEKLKKKLVHALKSNGDISFEEDGNPSKRKRDVVICEGDDSVYRIPDKAHKKKKIVIDEPCIQPSKSNFKTESNSSKVMFEDIKSPEQSKVYEKTPLPSKSNKHSSLSLSKTTLFTIDSDESDVENIVKPSTTQSTFNAINVWHETDLYDFVSASRKDKKEAKSKKINKVIFSEELGGFIPVKDGQKDRYYFEKFEEKLTFHDFYERHGREKKKYPITDESDDFALLNYGKDKEGNVHKSNKSPINKKSEAANQHNNRKQSNESIENIEQTNSEIKQAFSKNFENSMKSPYFANNSADCSLMEYEENEYDNMPMEDNNVRDKEQLQKSIETVEEMLCTIKDKGVLIIPANATVYLHGLARFTLLEGCLEVNGYVLKKDKEYKLYSPRGTSYLYLKNVWFQKKASEKLSEESAKFLEEIKAKYTVGKNDAVCVCKKLNDKSMEFIEKHISQKLFPTNARFLYKETMSSGNPLVPAPEWSQMFKAVRLNNGGFEKILLCGGKGVGKSTLLRYACNTFLKDYEQVLVIDLDPGQPEFSIPGCLSATIIKEPLFGPNYTHLQNSVESFYLGIVNVSQNPHLYLQCVKKLIESCNAIDNMPILINCMGFTRGLGLELMISILNIVQPHRVIELYGSPQKNFAELLNYNDVKTRNELFGYKSEALVPYALFRVKSMSSSNKGWELQPRQVREMSILAYFSQVLPDNVLSITDKSIPLYISTFNTVENFSDPKVVAGSLGQLVALCSQITDGIYKCAGFGIVKGIDMENSEFALITPNVILEDNEVIKYLITGTVTLPPSLYMTEDDNSGMIPYIQPGNLSGFTQMSKRSYMSAKRPQNENV